MDHAFDDEFLQRLSALAAEVDNEGMAAAESDFDDETEIEESGDDQAYKEIADLLAQRTRAFAEIVQFLSDQDGQGPIDRLPAEQLESLVRDACDAADQWIEDAEMEDVPPEPKTPLEHLLKRHYELGESLLDIQDEILADAHGTAGDDE